MLGKLSRFASPEVAHLLRQLEEHENSYNAELRTYNRQKIVIPATITTGDDEFHVHAFTRNISKTGVSVISPQPFGKGSEMNFELALHKGEHRKTSGRCIWSESFGTSYWTSGWEISCDLDVDYIVHLDGLIDWDNRATEREKFAVPVVIRLKGSDERIPAFTRDMSGDGVNLVSSQSVDIGTFCLLEIVRGDGERCEVVAECVWARPFDTKHWMTGWQFPRLDRIAQFHRAQFN